MYTPICLIGIGSLPNPDRLRGVRTFNSSSRPPTLPIPDTHPLEGNKNGELQVATDIKHVPGASSLPPELLKKIWSGEFVDMAELLPQSWRTETDPKKAKSRRPPITDIVIWSECFATYAAAVVAKHPGKAAQLFGYLKTIMKASRNFDGCQWVTYDTAFRRQAANCKSWDWGTVDGCLYSETFAGRARIQPRCATCLEGDHQTEACPLAPPTSATPKNRPPTSTSNSARRPSRAEVQLCGLFNRSAGNQCNYPECKFAHICSLCRAGLPDAPNSGVLF